MDEAIQLQPEPKHTTLYAVLALIGLLVLGALAYGLYVTTEKNPLGNSFSEVYLTPQNDGTVAWYEYVDGSLVQHPAPAPGRITGLARAGGDMYFTLVPYTNKSAAVYRFSGGTYTSLYENKTNRINQLSVSADGSFVAFIDSATSSSATVVEVITRKVTSLSKSTILPQFLSVNGETAVLYSNGTDLVAQAYSDGTWQSPHVVHKGTGATMSVFATNGKELFAYVDPVDMKVHEMQISGMTPFVSTETTTYPGLRGNLIGYGGERLFGYHYSLGEDNGQYLHLTVVDAFGGTGKTYSYKAPASINSSSAVFLLPTTSSP